MHVHIYMYMYNRIHLISMFLYLSKQYLLSMFNKSSLSNINPTQTSHVKYNCVTTVYMTKKKDVTAVV